jgi:ABC-type multidrug transport system ATPase subunit
MSCLKIKGISKSFRSKKALSDINLDINTGIYGLLGPNGAGKTTLMRIIATIMRPSTGEISYEDISWNKHPQEARNILGYLPQQFGSFKNITAWDCLDYIAVLKGVLDKAERNKQIETILHEVNLLEVSKKKIKSFSGGMLRRLGIAQTMLGDPKLIIVDEPTAGLDPEERIRFRGFIRKIANQKIVILSTHIAGDVQAVCDSVAVLNNGTITNFNNLQELSNVAKGRVWKLNVSVDEYSNIEKKYRIMSSNNTDNNIELRLLSDTIPSYDAISVEPNIEEGYMAWINQQKA